MIALALRCLAAGCALAVPAIASDRIVDRNNPNAYPTLQAALDAANPGDRILLRTSDFGVMRGWNRTTKSVTIRGEGGDIVVLGQSALEIASLTPGLPLVLENLTINVHTTGVGPRAAIWSPLGSGLGGEVILDGVTIDSWTGAYDVACGVDVSTTRLSIRNSHIQVWDTPNNNACCEELYRDGADAVRFVGNELYIEDSTLRAGSANLLIYSSTCFALCPEGGHGGAALHSDSRSTVVVRSVLSDGNGGSVQAASAWPRSPIPGAPA